MKNYLTTLWLGVLMICIIVISGCFSIPTAKPELHEVALKFTPPPGMAYVYVVHQKEWASHHTPFLVSLDSEYAGSVMPGQYIFGAIESGSHELFVKTTVKSNVLRFNVEPGKVYFINSNIPFMSSLKIEQIDEAEGQKKVRAYEQSAHNDFIYPITRAARFGQKDRVHALLAAGENVNVRDWWGKTALIWAVERGDAEIVRLLVDHGAVDVFKNASDELNIKTGFTALKMAEIKKEQTEQIVLSAEEVKAKGGKVWKLSKPQTREKIVLFEGMSADLFKVAVGQIELGVVSKEGTKQHEYAFLPHHVSTSHSKKVKTWPADVMIKSMYKPDTGWKAKTCIGDIPCPKIDVIGSSKNSQVLTDYSFPIEVSAQIGMGVTADLDIAKNIVFTFNAKGELQNVTK